MLLCLSIIAPESADIPELGSLLRTWSFPPLPFLTLSLTVLIYLLGWRVAHRTRWRELPPWRAASFVAGIASLWIAIASPIDALDDFLLAAHMMQHFILMSIAPPLIVLGAPTVPLLRGLPKALRALLRPMFRARWFHRAAQVSRTSRGRLAADEHCLPGMARAGRIRTHVPLRKHPSIGARLLFLHLGCVLVGGASLRGRRAAFGLAGR